MRNSPLLSSSLFCGALVLGCADEKGDTTANTTTNPVTSDSVSSTVDPTAGTTGAGPTSTGVDPTMPNDSVTDASASSSTTVDTCSGFVCPTDMITNDWCDLFLQDCPDGEKCAAVITDGGGAWNSYTCVPVGGDGVAGDACVAKSVADGLDNCAEGNMCWGVDMDGNGTCVELCKGSYDAPLCPNNGVCTIENDGVLNLCLPTCDPLLQDCAEGDACYPNDDDDFICAPDASGDTGKANDPCEFLNVCAAGLVCGDPAFVGAGCPLGSMGCCTPFCAFPDGACPNPDQTCVQWFDPMMLPEGDPRLAIGSCGIPS